MGDPQRGDRVPVDIKWANVGYMIMIFNSVLNVLITFIIFLVCFLGF